MQLKRLFILTSIFITIIFFPSLLLGWFAESSEVSQPFYDPTSQVSTTPGIFYVYDNIVSGQNREDTPYIMPLTNHFVPADTIHINVPLQSLYERTFSISESLDTLLNANLALQLLLEQYRELQKRTSELLKSLNLPYLENLQDKSINNTNISLNKKDNSRVNTAQESESIRLEADKLTHQISETVRNMPNGTFYLSNKDIPSFAGLRVDQELQIGSGKKVFSVVGNGTSMQVDKTVSDLGFSGGLSEGGRIASNEITDREGKGRVSINGSYGSEQNELPWIFRAAINTIGYITANKVESIFYGLILFSIFYFIFIGTRE